MDDNTGQPMAEKYPMGEKLPVDLHRPCTVTYQPPKKEIHRTTKTDIPEPSFKTNDMLYFARQGIFDPYTNERGSACCISISYPYMVAGTRPTNTVPVTTNSTITMTTTKLLVGISHCKTPFKGRETRHNSTGGVGANHFLSSFYAMESVYPYKVVARSGRFCLGFASEGRNKLHDGYGMDDVPSNPYIRSNHRPLTIGEIYPNCPQIHFVSGMIEKADDPSKVIVTYGINDCVPRMIEWSKQDILHLLFQSKRNGDSSNTI